MARISTYERDNDVSPNDIVIGSNYNIDNSGRVTYTTRNYRMIELQNFFQGANFSATEPIRLTGTTNKVWSHDDITIITTNSADPAGITLQDNTTFITATDVSFGGLSNHVNGFTRKEFTLPNYQFQISTSNNGSHVRIIDIDSASGTGLDTLNINSGNKINTRISANKTVTIDHANYTSRSLNTSNVDVLDIFTSDEYGHVTSISKRTLPTMGSGNNYAVGLVLAGSATHNNNFLRKDGTWQQVVSTSITTTDGTFINLTPDSATSGSVTVTADLSATGTASNATFLRGDNQWATPPGTYTLPLATSSLRGGVKIGYVANATNYPVELTQEKMYVNVPTYSAAVSDAAGTTGLMPGAAAGQQNFLMTGSGSWQNLTFTISGKQYNNAGPSILGITMSGGGTSFGIQHADTNSGNQLAVSNTGRNVIQSITIDPYGHVTDMTSNDVSYSVGDGGLTQNNFTNALKTKLDGIEDNATADQTATEIRNLIGTGNDGVVPSAGSSGQFLKHDGTFGTPPDTNTFRTVTAGGNILGDSETLAFTAGSNVTITELDGAVTIASTDTNNTYFAGGGLDLTGSNFSLTVTTNTANTYYKIPFINNNVINIDNTTSDFSFNPSTNGLTVGTIGVGVTPFPNVGLSSSTNIDLIGNGGILSYASSLYLTANTYYDTTWKAKNTGTTGMLIVRSNDLRYFVDTTSRSAGTSTSISQVFSVSSSGNVVAIGHFTGTNFKIGSDKRLKSEIEPIKEGLEVIKKFSSYNYIKGGEKESGFIAQEVKEAIPHTVYENNEGYLSMSDRGVLAHMHKAILELDKRLTDIENKIK